jgi:hypothetical protein
MGRSRASVSLCERWARNWALRASMHVRSQSRAACRRPAEKNGGRGCAEHARRADAAQDLHRCPKDLSLDAVAGSAPRHGAPSDGESNPPAKRKYREWCPRGNGSHRTWPAGISQLKCTLALCVSTLHSARVKAVCRMQMVSRCSAYPRLPAPMPTIRGRLLRRDVDGAIHPPRADGRRLEGERDGSRSRRPAATVSGGAAVMSPIRRPPRGTWPTVTDGVRPMRSTLAERRSSQRCPKSLSARVPKGNALGRATAPLWLRSRRSRTRRTSPAKPAGLEALEHAAGEPLDPIRISTAVHHVPSVPRPAD